MAALAAPSRRRCVRVRRFRGCCAGRVSVFELLVSRREPTAPLYMLWVRGGYPHPAARGAGSDFSAATWGVARESPSPQPSPSRERGFGSREAGGHVGPPLRRVSHRASRPLPEGEGGSRPYRTGLRRWGESPALGSHPHPNPLPSRERGFGSREAGGHVGPPLRRGVTLTPTLSLEGAGGGSREAGGHVGPPLRRLSRRAGLFLASRERGCGRAVRRGLCVL